MKTLLLFLGLTICLMPKAFCQQHFKVKYISYKSETKNELDGTTLAIYKYEKSRITVLNQGKELLITDTKDAVLIRFFQKLPWNKKAGIYAKGFYAEDRSKGENISYYVQATVSKDLRTINLGILNKDENTNKIIDDVRVIYESIKSKSR